MILATLLTLCPETTLNLLYSTSGAHLQLILYQNTQIADIDITSILHYYYNKGF